MRAVSETKSPPHVLILGGGFAGVAAARRLKDVDVDVTLVDRRDYHTFQPMISQLAAGAVGTDVVAQSLQEIFGDQKNASVLRATVEDIAFDRRRVHFADMGPLEYDYLVIGLGARASFSGVKGAAEHAFPMYGVADAVRLRQHLDRRLEAASEDETLVVVVGGGTTGVEIAGTLSDLYAGGSGASSGRTRLILVEAQKELFPTFEPAIRSYVSRELRRRGVELMLGNVVERVSPTAVTLRSGAVLKTQTIVWGGGLRPRSVVGRLDLALEQGRLPVEPDLTVAGRSEVFALGDCALVTESHSGRILPQLATVAIQAGAHAGESIARRLKGKAGRPFVYHDRGMVAPVGSGAAVMQLDRGRIVHGSAAWLAWGTVHLGLLSTGEDRVKSMIEWAWARFTEPRQEPDETLERALADLVRASA